MLQQNPTDLQVAITLGLFVICLVLAQAFIFSAAALIVIALPTRPN